MSGKGCLKYVLIEISEYFQELKQKSCIDFNDGILEYMDKIICKNIGSF